MWSDRSAGAAPAWLDSACGPVVRPFTLTRGRVAGDTDVRAALVVAVPDRPRPVLPPEHRALLAWAVAPTAVTRLVSRLDLAPQVVLVLIADLLAEGLLTVVEPGGSSRPAEDGVLEAVIHGLRAL